MKKDTILDTLNRSRGLDREYFIRPRSTVYKDKSKYNRQNGKLQTNKDWAEAEKEGGTNEKVYGYRESS